MKQGGILLKIINSSACSVVLDCGGRKVTLDPGEETFVSCNGQRTLCLRLEHLYPSGSLTESEIALDKADSTMLSLLIYRPYFEIVLDSEYVLDVPKDEQAVLCIRREHLRATYECAYDRLYPYSDTASVVSENYDFREKEEMRERYRRATKKGSIPEVIGWILLIGVWALGCPLSILLAVFVNPWVILIGLLLMIVLSVPLGGVLLFYRYVSKRSDRQVLSDFESERIAEHFQQAKGKKDAIQVD